MPNRPSTTINALTLSSFGVPPISLFDTCREGQAIAPVGLQPRCGRDAPTCVASEFERDVGELLDEGGIAKASQKRQEARDVVPFLGSERHRGPRCAVDREGVRSVPRTVREVRDLVQPDLIAHAADEVHGEDALVRDHVEVVDRLLPADRRIEQVDADEDRYGDDAEHDA